MREEDTASPLRWGVFVFAIWGGGRLSPPSDSCVVFLFFILVRGEVIPPPPSGACVVFYLFISMRGEVFFLPPQVPV